MKKKKEHWPDISYEIQSATQKQLHNWQKSVHTYKKSLWKIGFKVFKNSRGGNLSDILNHSRLDPGQREKINLNAYIHTSLWHHKRFYKGL